MFGVSKPRPPACSRDFALFLGGFRSPTADFSKKCSGNIGKFCLRIRGFLY